jgi:DNA repair protein RadC
VAAHNPKEETPYMTADPDPPIFRIRELEVRYKAHRLRSPFQGDLDKVEDVARLAAEILQDRATEVVLIVHLNIRHKLIGLHQIPGMLDRVHVSVPDVCRAILLSNAHAVIVVHNHVSGDPRPSDDDRRLVQRLKSAALVLNFVLLDAVIIGDETDGPSHYSFRKNGLL